MDGKFRYSMNYQLRQQVEQMEQDKTARATPSAAESAVRTFMPEIKDERQQFKVVYPLDYVYLVALPAGLSGQTSCVQIADYWANNRPAPEEYFPDFPRENISHDTVRRLLMLIDPQQFASFYSRLVTPLLDKMASRIVAVDGQAVRASKNPQAASGRYLLCFWDTENGIALGQKLIGPKGNEITYAAEMVKDFDLAGCVVTADALNTQKEFARELVDAGGDCCLAVKGNQKHLYLDIQMAFADVTETRGKLWGSKCTLAHGRIGHRSVCVLPASVLAQDHLDDWGGLEEGCIVRATTSCENKKSGDASQLDRFFISTLRWDHPFVADQAARAVRRHWGIENELHCVLDVDFYQDRTQCKNANYINNRILLNKFGIAVLNKLQQKETEKTGKDAMSKRRSMHKLHAVPSALKALSEVYAEVIHA
ncbi:ISAs1 family transposase [Mesosutterella sp. AGMB02718]|uniref:ISAs1 family transposase n=1 Tax=Mesosutterella faecium TaxID=2925194 RepID=A0ABT7IJD5_9BURK|nr:ISAs1 family transposase [Mesosutterella sp. AGMB02718]MDL2058475.1 ISAs1 family transposase [Mesosutterella sp. AGMB02718]